MIDDVNNATNPLSTNGAEPTLPLTVSSQQGAASSPREPAAAPEPATAHEPTPRQTNPLESVENEAQVGPNDLTGHDDTGAATDASPVSQPEVESPVAQPEPVSRAAQPTPVSAEPEEETPVNRQWYILKVQTNREDSIRDALQRRVAMAGLDKYFGEIIVPTEMVSEFKGGKKRVSKRKLYPGYIVVNMEINDDTWYLVRETSGIGDFTGAMGRPTPMAPQDVAKILQKTEEKTDEQPRVDIRHKQGDRVRIKEGTFENFEGTVEGIDQANGRVTVMINIFGRSTPVELEYWQIEAV